jgi:hypothetical protein
MLNLLDEMLRQILMADVESLRSVRPTLPPAPVSDDQVRFETPDENWRSSLTGLNRNALNVYLVELRENRRLRSNERTQTIENGMVHDQPAPARVDCHYLISAWSPTTQLTPQVEPVLDEHMLLYEAAAALMHAVPFNPSRVYPPGSTPLNAWPERFRNADLPAIVAPVEGFPKLAEFWGTMGQKLAWKPVLYLIVTVPVDLLREVAGPIVTTRITEYRQWDRPDSGEVWIQIGGHVFNPNNPLPDGSPSPVVAARVEVLDRATGRQLQLTETNALGRYTFLGLRPGGYSLSASAPGLTMASPRDVLVPSPTGEYDLRF